MLILTLVLILILVLVLVLVLVFCLVFGRHLLLHLLHLLRPMMVLTCPMPILMMVVVVMLQKKLVTYPWWEILSCQRKSLRFVAGRSSPSWSLEVPWHVRNSPCQ